MSCIDTKSPEQIRNLISSGMPFWDITSEMTVEDIVQTFDTINDVMQLSPEIDDKGNTFYTILGHLVKHRVSDLGSIAAKRNMDKYTKAHGDEYPDTKLKAKVGTKIHGVMQLLIDNMYNNKGSIKEINDFATTGAFSLSSVQLGVLKKLASYIITTIEETQKKIDPEGTAIIRPEQKMYDPTTDRGGTADILVIYSDKTGGLFDFKTKNSYGGNFKNQELVDELIHPNSISDYELNMTEYKRIAMQRHGLKAMRHNRLVPIHIRLKMLPKEERTTNHVFTDTLELVEATPFMSEFLEMIPVSGEATKYEGLNKLLERQYSLLNKLNDKLRKKNLSSVDKDRITLKLNTLRKSIQNTIVRADVSDILTNVSILINDANAKFAQPEFLDDNTKNPNFPSDRELEELIQELSVYDNIIDNTNVFFKEMESKSNILFKQMNTKLDYLYPKLILALSDLKQLRERRILSIIPGEYKNTPELLAALPQLDFLTTNFSRISEIDHPLFEAAWTLFEKAINSVRTNVKSLDEEISEKEKALITWAKSQGMNMEQAFNKMIDFNTGNLVSMLSKELLDKIETAYQSGEEEDINTLKSILEIKNIDTYKERYQERLEKSTGWIEAQYAEEKWRIKDEITKWKDKNDLLNSPKAWINSKNRWQLTIKEDVKLNNRSEEYKYLLQNKPLLDYYNMYIESNKKFRKLLGIYDYRELPPNLIPNVRKEMIQHLTMRDGGFKTATGEFVDSFRVREEDVFIADIDETGQLRRNIPVLYTHPFRNKDGSIDNVKKSYDLSKSLLLFAKMAYNYDAMNKIEPNILALKQILGEPTSEQEGTIVTTNTGRKVRGKIKEFATTHAIGTDAYQLFEDFSDYYLYGIKFKAKSLSKSINTTKLISSIKQYHSKTKLGFAVIPAFGAYIAGKTGTIFEANKGVSYTKAQLVKAQVHKTKDYKNYKLLSSFFDTYAEDPLQRLTDTRSANWANKLFNSRTLFLGLRHADENITDLVLNSMAHNFGIDKEGNLLRLNIPGRVYNGEKSIAELFKIDEKTGKAVIDITENTYLAFRAAVKETVSRIIGSLSQEDISRQDANLFLNVLMHYKTWMPGIIREQFGGLKYDKKLQAVHWGRARAAFSEISMTKTERTHGALIGEFVRMIVLPSMAKASLDLITFGIAPKLGLGYKYTDPSGVTRNIRSNPERARRRYIDWMTENPKLHGKVTFEMFLEIKEAQMRTMLLQLRVIFGFLGFLMFLGADGDDGEARYMDNWISRFIYKSMAKGQSELMFVWNPNEFQKLIKNPIPILSLLGDLFTTLKNTVDETRDFMFGENSPQDKTPAFYSTVQWAYGGSQLSRFLELYKQYEKSPY